MLKTSILNFLFFFAEIKINVVILQRDTDTIKTYRMSGRVAWLL